MNGLDQLNWRRIGAIFIGVNAALIALVGRAAAQAKREEEERTHVRWTDANRWDK